MNITFHTFSLMNIFFDVWWSISDSVQKGRHSRCSLREVPQASNLPNTNSNKAEYREELFVFLESDLVQVEKTAIGGRTTPAVLARPGTTETSFESGAPNGRFTASREIRYARHHSTPRETTGPRHSDSDGAPCAVDTICNAFYRRCRSLQIR